jgi:hypothetical protein
MGQLSVGRTLLSAAFVVDFAVSQASTMDSRENLAELRSAWTGPFDFAQGRLRTRPHTLLAAATYSLLLPTLSIRVSGTGWLR